MERSRITKPFFTPAPNPGMQTLGHTQSLFSLGRMSGAVPRKQAMTSKAAKVAPKATIASEQTTSFSDKKKIVSTILATKKVAMIAAPIIAQAVWSTTDINEMPANYSPPQ